MLKIQHPFAWLFCAFAALGACLYGYDGVYFTGVTAIDKFIEHFGTRNSDGTYEISSSRLSLMTSVINIGELVGSLTAAPVNDYLGRKGVFFVASILVIVGVILQLVATHQVSYIIGGRILLGYGVGNLSATSPLYIGVSQTHVLGDLEALTDCSQGNCPHCNPRPTPHVLAARPLCLSNHRRRH